MKGYLRVASIILILIGFAAGCVKPEESTINSKEASPKGINGKVLSVTDGDTIKVQLNNGQIEKVRMILIDTPETKHPRLGSQPFGEEASNFTTRELTGKVVKLELDVEERDRYGRLLAYVWIDHVLFNEKLLEAGLARVAVYPPNTKYVDRFREIQNEAQTKGINIWSLEDYARQDGYHTDSSKEAPSAPSNESNLNTGDRYVNDSSDDKEENLGCSGKIKGNANSKIYHVPGGSYYESVKDHIVWFCSEAEAESAGYRKSKR